MTATEVLRDVLVILIAAKIAAEIAERINIPAVVGEIVAGVIIGPSLLGLVGSSSALDVLAELGVILLLLQVGMEMDIDDLAAVGRASVSVAALGVVLPLVSGYAAGIALGYNSNTALFLGAALAATSVGITARVFSDLGALATVEARTVLGAAVADDVLGLVLLTIVVKIVGDGGVSVGTVASTVLLAIGFLVVTAVLGGRLGTVLFRFIQRRSRSAGTLVALALAFALAFAELADVAKLAPIVGAFVAGLALSRSESRERIARDLTPVGHLFIPVFFLQIGIAAQVERFVDPSVLGVAGVLVVVALVGKLVSAIAVLNAPGDKLLIGIGMIPRGEVGLIFATIGLTNHVLGRDLYAALLLVVLVTTLMAPPLLRMRLRTLRGAARSESVDPMPASGWLWVDDGVVDLAANPPGEVQTIVALDAALFISGGARPGPRLVTWLSLGDPAPWNAETTTRLVEVLVRGNDRGWRFLDTSGVLVRSLPEVAEAVDRWHRDPELVDPTRVVRFGTIDALQRLVQDDSGAAAVHSRLRHPDRVVLAALVIDLAGEHRPVELVRSLVERFDLDQQAHDELLVLSADHGVLRGISSRRDGLAEASVLGLTAHLASRDIARALYLLDLAIGSLSPVERDRIDTLVARVIATFDELDASGSGDAFSTRRDEAIRLAGNETRLVDRIEHAPWPYLLAELPERVVQHARLLEPRPERREVRVDFATTASRTLTIDVVARDQPGLLAAVTNVFANFELDVLSARVATWGDGSALETFTVEPRPGVDSIAETTLGDAICQQLGRAMESAPLPDAAVAFDDAGSPWYTICEVRHVDRPGLLAIVTAALAASGASVHAAELAARDGMAIDQFSLTNRDGGKLRRAEKESIRDAILEGRQPSSRIGRLTRRRG
ncbi:MAG: cation:proton antiporter [Acidimicrobiia bacterium]